MFQLRMTPVSRFLFTALMGPAMALAMSVSSALSLESGWAETEGGRMRLVVDPTPRDDGMIAGYLDVALDPGWKTYWRDPGGSGIPPMLDFSQSRGITFEEMAYPPPVRINDGYAIWSGYTAPVQFPLIFRRTASGDAQIRALAFIGICDKICVPFQAELAVELPGNANSHDSVTPLVEAAFARLPEPAGADFNLENVSLDLNGQELEVSANLPAFRPAGVTPELFVAGPDGFAFARPVLTADEGGHVSWSVRVESIPDSVSHDDKVALDLVVTLGQRAIGQRLDVEPAASE